MHLELIPARQDLLLQMQCFTHSQQREQSFSIQVLHQLRKSWLNERILYVLDNCGEAVFDRVFMEPYREKIVLGVRGCNVFNDVTREDLKDCGLEGFTKGVVSNGPEGYPGVILQEASEDFLKEFNSADLVISKGQGNFETLSDSTAPIAFLFLAKCPVVLREINAELHSIQVRTINF